MVGWILVVVPTIVIIIINITVTQYWNLANLATTRDIAQHATIAHGTVESSSTLDGWSTTVLVLEIFGEFSEKLCCFFHTVVISQPYRNWLLIAIHCYLLP